MTEDNKSSSTNESRFVSFPLKSGAWNPIVLCAAFAAGLFIATVTFNLAMYFSLRGKYEHAVPIMPTPLEMPASKMLRPTAGKEKHPASVLVPTPRLGVPKSSIYDNIVMIEVRFATYNRAMPWQTVRATFQPGLELASMAQASGLILENGLILTSAYVATDSYLITVMRQGEAREYEAEVVGHARELDIGLINVKDPKFWKDTDIKVSLETSVDILGRGNQVTVAGFPVGQDLSISKLSTRVSRVEADAPGYSGRYGSFPQPVLSLYPKIGSDVTVGPVLADGTDELWLCGQD
jgi:S1-C subfamily serine protease